MIRKKLELVNLEGDTITPYTFFFSAIQKLKCIVNYVCTYVGIKANTRTIIACFLKEGIPPLYLFTTSKYALCLIMEKKANVQCALNLFCKDLVRGEVQYTMKCKKSFIYIFHVYLDICVVIGVKKYM